MGLPHSGDLMDLAVLMRVERYMLRAENLHQYKVIAYFRFCDDILYLAETLGSNGGLGFVSGMKRLARYFTIKCEAVSKADVDFLRLHIPKTSTGYATEFKLKPESLRRGSLIVAEAIRIRGDSPLLETGWPTHLPQQSSQAIEQLTCFGDHFACIYGALAPCGGCSEIYDRVSPIVGESN